MLKPLPKELLQALSIGNVDSLDKLAGNANDNYLVGAAGKRVVIKCLGEHTPENEELEGVYRQYLIQNGLPVAPFLRFKNGRYTLTIDGKSYVALEYLEGEEARGKQAYVAGPLASLSGKFHTLAFDSMPERDNWMNGDYLEHVCRQGLIAEAEQSELRRHNATFPDFWNIGLPIGIGHGDLHLGNTIIDAHDEIVSLIDWEEVGIVPLILDVAGTVQALSQDLDGFNETVFSQFFDSYQIVRPLKEPELQLFPEAIRYRSFVVYIWALTKYNQRLMSLDLVDYFKQRFYSQIEVPEIPKPYLAD